MLVFRLLHHLLAFFGSISAAAAALPTASPPTTFSPDGGGGGPPSAPSSTPARSPVIPKVTPAAKTSPPTSARSSSSSGASAPAPVRSSRVERASAPAGAAQLDWTAQPPASSQLAFLQPSARMDFLERAELESNGVNIENLGKACFAECKNARVSAASGGRVSAASAHYAVGEGECESFCGVGALCCRDGWGHEATPCGGLLGPKHRHECVVRASPSFIADMQQWYKTTKEPAKWRPVTLADGRRLLNKNAHWLRVDRGQAVPEDQRRDGFIPQVEWAPWSDSNINKGTWAVGRAINAGRSGKSSYGRADGQYDVGGIKVDPPAEAGEPHRVGAFSSVFRTVVRGSPLYKSNIKVAKKCRENVTVHMIIRRILNLY